MTATSTTPKPAAPAYADEPLERPRPVPAPRNVVLSAWLCVGAGVLMATALVPVALQALHGRTD